MGTENLNIEEQMLLFPRLPEIGMRLADEAEIQIDRYNKEVARHAEAMEHIKAGWIDRVWSKVTKDWTSEEIQAALNENHR